MQRLSEKSVGDGNTSVINTWLLSWNPSVYAWEDFDDDDYNYASVLKTVKSGGTVFLIWKCISKKIKTGDRIFLIKLGNVPKGIFATGYAASDTYEGEYTDDEGNKRTERLVEICITGFLDYHTEELISQKMLKELFPEQQWSPQGSGIIIYPKIARWIIDYWDSCYFNNHNVDSKPIEVTDTNEVYTKEDFLKDVYITEQEYNQLMSLMKNKKNIILQGAPGVGKTYTAKRLAYAFMGIKDDSRIEFVQFHQNYSYEDFIMGYRPNETGGFHLTEGVFYKLCKKAEQNPELSYFFIIDEINRGNISKIFGELLMLIENDKRSGNRYAVRLAYRDEQFSVPDNLYIVGMMNTADRSLAMLDYALRRRFSFFEMNPGFDSDGFIGYCNRLNNKMFNDLIKNIIMLNEEIQKDSSLGSSFCIGHSYFCNLTKDSCTKERLRSIVEFDIIPMLKEYWFDDHTNLEEWIGRLRGVLNDK